MKSYRISGGRSYQNSCLRISTLNYYLTLAHYIIVQFFAGRGGGLRGRQYVVYQYSKSLHSSVALKSDDIDGSEGNFP